MSVFKTKIFNLKVAFNIHYSTSIQGSWRVERCRYLLLCYFLSTLTSPLQIFTDTDISLQSFSGFSYDPVVKNNILFFFVTITNSPTECGVSV
jgi:hypothetical protein